MSTKRLSMRKLREVLRCRLAAGLSMRQIRDSLRISLGAIQKIISQADALGLDWSTIEQLDDRQLAQAIYPQADTRTAGALQRPDWEAVHRSLKGPGVTKQLLWEEYSQHYPNRSYSYPQYCHLYQAWRKQQKRSLRQIHKAGDKLFVDYAGHTVPIVQGATGAVRFAEVFVAVLGASNYTFAEATWTQQLPDWLGSHVRALEFFGGAPRLLVPDNLKSGVTKACRYDPDLNPSYQQFGAHYGVAILPARPRKPQDKAKVEVGVQIIERWILARLRQHTFFSLAELNHCIRALLTEVNQRPFKRLPGNRRQWFEALDQPALQPLPKHRYEYTAIKNVKVNVDYHVQYAQHLYSVPHALVGETLQCHAREQLLELYFHNKRVASHVRQNRPGMTTEAAHMPQAHERHQHWSAARLLNWAQDLGAEVLLWVKAQLAQKAHEQQAYRVCLGLLNLSRAYPAARLNRACAIANRHQLYRLKQLKSILQSNQDQLVTAAPTQPALLPQAHENIRGPNSFH